MISKLLFISIFFFFSCNEARLPGATNKEVQEWYCDNISYSNISKYALISRRTGDTIEIIGKSVDTLYHWDEVDSLNRTGIQFGIEFNEKEIMAVPILKHK